MLRLLLRQTAEVVLVRRQLGRLCAAGDDDAQPGYDRPQPLQGPVEDLEAGAATALGDLERVEDEEVGLVAAGGVDELPELPLEEVLVPHRPDDVAGAEAT